MSTTATEKMPFNMTNALVVTVEGLLIVFAVLVVIMLVLYAMRLFAKEEEVRPTQAPVPMTAPKEQTLTVSDVDVDALDEGEKIAIFSAAIAAYSDTPISGINISSYKKIN